MVNTNSILIFIVLLINSFFAFKVSIRPISGFNNEKYVTESYTNGTKETSDSLTDQNDTIILLVYKKTLSLNLKCLHTRTIHPYQSELISIIDADEKINSLRFSVYFEVIYDWDSHYRQSYAELNIVSLLFELNGEAKRLKQTSQSERILINSSGSFTYRFKNQLIADFEIREIHMEVNGRYNCTEYDMEGNQFFLLSCNNPDFSFEVVQKSCF